MSRGCGRLAVAALALVDSARSFCTSSYGHPLRQMPAWTKAGLNQGRPRPSGRGASGTGRDVPWPTAGELRTQAGAGLTGTGDDYQASGGGHGYGGGVAPSWPPQRTPISDGFGEGIPRLNTIVLTGYLGQDPKPRYFESGKVVLNLSLAVKREYHPLERKALGIVYGEEETDWFQLEMWNRDAEYAAKLCRKGGRVGVTGSLNISEWVDKEGNLRTTMQILVQNLEILDSRAERASRSDRSEDNLWESERLQKTDAAAQRQASSGGAEAGDYQTQEDIDSKARKKAAEDKWWSATPDAGTGGGGKSWWEEDRDDGSASGLRGIEPDALPSFFDE